MKFSRFGVRAATGARHALFAALVCGGGVSGGFEAAAQERAVCLSDIAAEAALNVAVLSTAPTALCEPEFRIVELRNSSGAPLGEARLEIVVAEDADATPFVAIDDQVEPPVFFEMSRDDGASWTPVEAPRRIDGRLVWTVEEAPPLARLGPNSAADDSVLLRWRAPLGALYGGPFAPEASIGVAGAAADACGRIAEAPLREAQLAALQPALSGRLVGRNATRGGPFSETVPAAPGDVIEWRLELENGGDATARAVTAAVLTPEGPILGAERTDAGADGGFSATGILGLDSVPPGALRATIFRSEAPASCGRQQVSVELAYGCAAPQPGRLSAIPTVGASPRAWIVSTPDTTVLEISPSVSGVDGASAPGAAAEISVVLANDGPPAFEPRLEIAPPDGYEIPLDAEVEFRAATTAAAGRLVGAVIEPGEGDRRIIRFVAAGDAPPVFSAGERLEVRVVAVRTRRTLGETDVVSAALLFEDGCGVEGRTAAARARTELRQAELSLEAEPVGGPILRLEDGSKAFLAVISNTGDARADVVTLAIEPGGAWRSAPPEECALDPEAAPNAPRFLCRFDDPLPPGGTLTRRFDLSLADTAFDPETTPGGLEVRFRAEARAADPSGAPAGATLARASAETSVAGFALDQRLQSPGGAPLDLATPIDLGQRVVIEVDAQWLGVGGGRIEDAAISLSLPPQLGFVSASLVEGDIDIVGARAPERGRSGRLLWSLGPISDGGAATLRVEAVAIDPPEASARDAFTASVSRGAAEADAIFTLDGATYGVDAAVDGPTRAAPLELLFRRPDLRVSLFVVGAETAEARFGDDAALAGEQRWLAAPGEVVIAEATLRNLGAGPGYFDWVRLEAPPGIEILPFGSDGVDNDDDGRIDEPDEAATASLGPAEETLGGPTATEARWSGAGGGALGGAERLIRPNGERVWRAALRLEPETPPDRAYALRVEAQFGAQPAPRAGDETRTRVIIEPRFGAAPIDGWFVLTETSFGGDLDEVVRAGEAIGHRLTARMPPGLTTDAVVTIDFSAAYRPPDRLDARFGPGVACADAGAGRVVEREDGPGWRAIWRLGDCRVDPSAPPEARLVIIDVGATVREAPVEVVGAARIDWRAPRVVGEISYVDAAAVDGRAALRLGETTLTLRGPAPQLSIDPPARPSAAADDPQRGALDAGDAYEAVARLVNAGDEPTSGVILRYGWTEEEAAAEGADCAALAVETVEAGAAIERIGPCIVEARIDFSEDPLAPGDVVEIGLRGGLAADAPLGGAVATPVAVIAAPAGAPPLEGWTVSDVAPRAAVFWTARLRAPFEPTLDVAERDGPAAVGDTVLARARFSAPEGAGPVVLMVRFRYEGRVGAATAAARPVIDVAALTISRSRSDMTAEADPSGLNAAALDAPIAVLADDYDLFVDREGWTVVAVPLGRVAFLEAGPELGDGAFTLELAAALADTPVASRGRLLIGEAALVRGELAALRAGEEIWTRSSDPMTAADLAEPFLDLAALHEDADGSAQLGERVVFVGRACNRGRAPAFGAALSLTLPEGFALDPNRPPSFLFDDGPEALGPRPYGEVIVEQGGALRAIATDRTPIEPGACVALRAPSFAETPAMAAAGADGVLSAPPATARFEIVSYRGRPSETSPGRLYEGVGPSSATVLRRDLVIDAPSVAYVDPDGWIRHPFTIRRAGRLRDDVRLSLVLSDTDELTWTIFLDVNRDGQVDGADRVWRNGEMLPADGGLAFIARARPETPPPIGWRRTALLRAGAVTPDGRLLTGAREIVAARGSERDGVMGVERLMAVDRDCDGRLDDESAQDATFEKAKDVAIGECVIMRLTFSNEDTRPIERVLIEDAVPDGVAYLEGSASFASTPAGLVGRGIDLPDIRGDEASASGRARLRFRFVGALAPGREGVVEYRVRVEG